MGEEGIKMMSTMFKALSQPKHEGETKADYEKRVIDPAVATLMAHADEAEKTA